jgi:hypothetical protein
MTTKQSALENIESLKPEPKKRRTAQEQALAPLLKEREKLVGRYADAQEKAQELAMALLKLDKMIEAIRGDEPSPESE